jgi:glycosyltransferase involved in cell wall biosynthesis
MKKTLLIGPFPYPIKGISLSNQTLYNGLKNKGYEVDFINTESNEKSIGTDFGAFSIRKLKFITKYFYCYKILLSQNIYITVGITFFGVLKYAPFILIGWLFNKNLIVHVHSNYLSTEYQNLKGIKRKIFKFLLQKFNKGIVLSEGLRHNLEDFIAPASIYAVPNFVQDELLQRVQISKDYTSLNLFFLSNLLEEKGINLLLKAIERLQNEGIYFDVKIAGSLVPSNPLPQLHTLKNVEYLGVVEGIAKQELLLWGTVFCLPTYFSMEGQPISIIEAMAFDNFILTTKHAGIPDICSEKNAVFCEKNSEQSLYEALRKLYLKGSGCKEASLQNGIYARTKYTEQKFIQRIAQILE